MFDKIILKKFRYRQNSGNNVCFRAYLESGEPFHTLTKSFSELKSHEIALDVLQFDWSYNLLIERNIIHPNSSGVILSGFNEYLVYQLTAQGMDMPFDSP